MNNIDVSGTHTAIVTPFREGEVDYNALETLVESQIHGRVNSIVAVGTTGESPTLTPEEHIEVITRTVEFANGRCLVIGGTGSNSTNEAIDYTREAENAGADGALIVAPYYNRPTQEGVFRHYRAIANQTKLPIILYSIQSRCGIEIETSTLLRLARECPNIIAIKEAGGNANKVRDMRVALDNAGFDNFQILSGDDGLTLPFMSVGASGVISVASNIIPHNISTMVTLMQTGHLNAARKIALRYNQLFNDLFIESNPVPTKTALSVMYPDIYTAEVRLPLCELQESSRNRLLETLRQTGLLETPAQKGFER